MVNIPVVLLITGMILVSSMELEPEYILTEEDYYRISTLRPLALEFVEYFENISEKNLRTKNSEQTDLQCLTEMSQLMKGLSARNMWALKSKYYYRSMYY